ncbi:cytochrome P450 [Athelia psychrophila]|uniref:Cytochrome P450 n=1 Tax=Athelia psychrophila TaxID=1759441 RepID=A0A166HUB7_9AGAM|nr:cytochrome P450 [Fibularhizoctonia sp. CBS 109695]
MPSLLTTTALILLPLLYFTHTFLLLLLRQRLSPLRLLPRPPAPSLLTGNLAELHDQENTGLFARWTATHGPSFCYRGFLGGSRLITTDPRAIAHILGHAYEYPKPDFVRDSLATMAAGEEGLLTVEGETHRRQRKIIAPAFGRRHVRSLAPVFVRKAGELRDRWAEMADAAPAGGRPPRVDVLAWLSRATLDVIGLAGFGYEFNALAPRAEGEAGDELAEAFATIFSTARKFRIMTILQVWFPLLRRFRRNNKTMADAQSTMRRIGTHLIDTRKAALASSKSTAIDGDSTVLGRDLLSVLIRSNLASAGTPAAQLSSAETLCQISTFIAAGFETTSSALSWALFALSGAPGAQMKLREAMRAVPPPPQDTEGEGGDGGGGGEDAWDAWVSALDALPYLDWTVRESLRLHAPITNTMRVFDPPPSSPLADKNTDVIPTSAPWVGRDGVTRTGIEIRRGDIISVPIQAVNRGEGVWGADAGVFRPERRHGVPGLYAGILTFLNGNPLSGNRACIGYRFALLEMKVFLYVLLRDLEVGIDPGLVIEKKINVVTRPFVASEPGLGNQLPLRISRVKAHGGDGEL